MAHKFVNIRNIDLNVVNAMEVHSVSIRNGKIDVVNQITFQCRECEGSAFGGSQLCNSKGCETINLLPSQVHSKHRPCIRENSVKM